MTCLRCQRQTCKRFGYFGKHRIQRWRCNSCKSTFCEPHTKLTRDMMLSKPDAVIRAIQCLVEGCSIRSTERLTGLNRNTIMRLLIVAGEHCARLMDNRMRNLSCKYLQVDELWCFVQKKSRHLRYVNAPEIGDQWIYVAIDAESKLIPAFRVGKRARPDTRAFLWDLYNRLANRVQLTTDALNHYTLAVPEAFGTMRTSRNSQSCLAIMVSTMPMRGTPQGQSWRSYPKCARETPILSTSRLVLWNGRTSLCGCSFAG